MNHDKGRRGSRRASGPLLLARADELTRDEAGLANANRSAFEQDARLATLGAETVVPALREAIEATRGRAAGASDRVGQPIIVCDRVHWDCEDRDTGDG